VKTETNKTLEIERLPAETFFVFNIIKTTNQF